MDEQQGGAAPQYSPDGKWWWDGRQWIAVPQAQSTQAPPSPLPARRRQPHVPAAAILASVVVVLVVVVALASAFGQRPAHSASAAATAATPTAPSPTATITTPTPMSTTPSTPLAQPTIAPTPAPPTQNPAAVAAQPTPNCTPTDDSDVLVRYIVPRLSPSAQRLGGVDFKCESTFDLIAKTSPTGAGYCTTAAWARDNPGYDPNADPAPPLKKVVLAVGGSC
jgi:hypothetical protein